MANPFDLAGRTAFISGASQGLGRHFALTLSKHGAAVCLAARQEAKLATLASEVQSTGGRVHTFGMDVTDPSSVEQAVATCEAEFGAIDILVNNAGVAVSKPFLEHSPADWDHVLATNLRGAFLLAQKTAAVMAERQAGSIINIASVLGIGVLGNVSAYSASKAGLVQLTRAMALELARHGIRVNAIAPGYIETDINREFFASEAGSRLVRKIPFRRLGQAEDLDGALLLLASDASRYMTGTVMTVDGGFLLG